MSNSEYIPPEGLDLGRAERRTVRKHQPADRRPDPRARLAGRQASAPALFARPRPTARRSRSCSRNCSSAAIRAPNMMPGRSASAMATSSRAALSRSIPIPRSPLWSTAAAPSPSGFSNPARSSSISPRNSVSSCLHPGPSAPRHSPGCSGKWAPRPSSAAASATSSLMRRPSRNIPINRYAMEAKRQFDVLNRRLADSEYIAGAGLFDRRHRRLALVRRLALWAAVTRRRRVSRDRTNMSMSCAGPGRSTRALQ